MNTATHYTQNGLLEKYARGILDAKQAQEIEELLQVDLELGEALELIYIRLENSENECLNATG